jgi:hypothetical protein
MIAEGMIIDAHRGIVIEESEARFVGFHDAIFLSGPWPRRVPPPDSDLTPKELTVC